MVDDLTMSYNGNRLSSVRDDAKQLNYAGATDFSGKQGQSYTLTHYTETGALKSDKGRNIAKIDYDRFSNPIRIQFTNGNVTKYVYSATGEKLQVIYQTAVPNISVAIGSTKELTASQIQYTDSVDYLLGGMLTLRNGRIDQYQFEEGYCQAEQYVSDANKDKFTFCYYDQDHLGNIRQVTQDNGTSKGKVIQKVSYYPFGLQLCDGTTDSNVQSHKYNGKELDTMHGLNTYDYGARQYNPVTARWDRIDPLAEKYYSISPYAYCAGNPVKYVDPDGRQLGDFVDEKGKVIGNDGIDDGKMYVLKTTKTKFSDPNEKPETNVKGAGITRSELNKTKKFIESNAGNANAFANNSIAYDNSVLIESKETRTKMVNVISADNGKGGDGDANNREYGGDLNPFKIAEPGPVSTDPIIGAAIWLEGGGSTFHSHCSGYKYVQTGPDIYSGRDIHKYVQHPSQEDLNNAGRYTCYVFGRGNGTTYIYNQNGVIATIPTEYFINPKCK